MKSLNTSRPDYEQTIYLYLLHLETFLYQIPGTPVLCRELGYVVNLINVILDVFGKSDIIVNQKRFRSYKNLHKAN